MRKRIDNKDAITDFAQVDHSLKQIALNDTFIDEQSALMNQQLISVKEQYEPDIQKRIDENKRLEKDIEKFLKSNRSLFEKIRSKILTFGKIGFQLGKRHLDKTKATTWEVITDKFFDQYGHRYVAVKKYLDKDGVVDALDKGKISLAEIEAIGAVIIQKDRPFYKVFKEKINNK